MAKDEYDALLFNELTIAIKSQLRLWDAIRSLENHCEVEIDGLDEFLSTMASAYGDPEETTLTMDNYNELVKFIKENSCERLSSKD